MGAQAWLEHAVNGEYADRDEAARLYTQYNGILSMIVGMITHADAWLLPKPE